MPKTILTTLCSFIALLSLAQVNTAGEVFELPVSAAVSTSNYMRQLTAIAKGPSRVQLSWTSSDSLNDFFSIERSSNQKDFETIAVLHVPYPTAAMEWVDESPQPGRIFYRLRTTLKDGSQSFAGMVSVVIDGRNSFRFYPNPADRVLILRSEYPIDITLIDANGKTRLTAQNLSGLQLMNVESLEKGVYILRVFNRTLNSLSIERLIKN